MESYRITIQPQSAFGTPLMGDTLFGQFCWGALHLFGEEKLSSLLEGYTNNKPFIIFSNAFPKGYLPLPTIPSYFFSELDEDRKQLKKLQWIQINDCNSPLSLWQKKSWNSKDDEILVKQFKNQVQSHNSIDRLLGTTTSGGQFAPYQSAQQWFFDTYLMDIYIIIDTKRLDWESCREILNNIGKFGFGRDASIGLGKYKIVEEQKINLSQYISSHSANCYMTLANSAPQNKDYWNKEYCYYQITTRFGRHGDRYAFEKNPFKKPIILAKAGAILTPNKMENLSFIGKGINNVSHIDKINIVHQGYAPIIPLEIDFNNVR